MSKNRYASSHSYSRRAWMESSVAFAGLIGTASLVQAQETEKRPLIISTWHFGKQANEVALKRIERGGSTLDGVEAGIRQAESAGLGSVGLSGNPNAAGYVQQDACIMHGPQHRAGSVAGIEGIRHPITVARRVMEHTPHVLLIGQGAREFAIAQNCEAVGVDQHAAKLAKWMKERKNVSALNDDNHDTIALLVLGRDGTISGGCSTSGLAKKLPGRVGDSPIIGSGLYVDNEVGAAGATGIGENIMRYCATFLIVEYMRQGLDPTSACKKVIARIAAIEPTTKKLAINFIALDKQGRYGAAGTDDFPHAVTAPGFSKVITAKANKP